MKKGVWITPAFPKLIYVLDEDNITRRFQILASGRTGSKMYRKTYGTGLYFCKDHEGIKAGDVYPCMGCRSFLTVEEKQRNADGSHKYYGRFNQGVVTINLVDVACSSEGDMDRFWEILETSAWNYAMKLSDAVMSAF